MLETRQTARVLCSVSESIEPACAFQTFDSQNRVALTDIIEDRRGTKSTILTSQMPVATWHEVIGDKTVTVATRDRIIYESHRIALRGGSLSKQSKTAQGESTN